MAVMIYSWSQLYSRPKWAENPDHSNAKQSKWSWSSIKCDEVWYTSTFVLKSPKKVELAFHTCYGWEHKLLQEVAIFVKFFFLLLELLEVVTIVCLKQSVYPYLKFKIIPSKNLRPIVMKYNKLIYPSLSKYVNVVIL